VTPRVLSADRVLMAAQRMLDDARAGTAAVAGFRFAAPTLILGSAQRSGALHPNATIVIVRRASGGGAVYADRDLLDVTVALPPGHPLLDADLTESYRWFGEAWQRALTTLAIETRLVSVAEARAVTDPRRAAARIVCFAGLSPYELVTTDGRKLVGFAQRRRGGAALIHAALQARGDQRRVLDYLTAPDGTARYADASASLADIGAGVSLDTVWEAVSGELVSVVNRPARDRQPPP
jgi:lipoate---protein ligase